MAKPDDRAPGDGFSVLWVTGPGRWVSPVQTQLEARGVRIEEVGLDLLVERASQRAPDLILFTGAAASAPKGLLTRLAERHPARIIPVVAVGADPKPKLASRFGLVARLDKDAGVEELVKQLLSLLKGLSRRPARWRIKAGLSDVEKVAARLARSSRCGLLAAPEGGAIAIDIDGAVAPPPADLVDGLSSLEELAFHERPPGLLRVLTETPPRDETLPSLKGARVLVVDMDANVAKDVAGQLEAAGAQARAVGPVSQAVHAAKGLDPSLVIVTAAALRERACAPLWTEPRVASAALLVVQDAQLRDASKLFAVAAELCAPELSLQRRLVAEEAVAERLETLGAARWLKVLGRCRHDVTFRVFAAAGRGRMDLSGGRVQGAAFRPADSRMALVDGRAAVDTLLTLPFGRVLAGPPSKIADLEGVARSRRRSMVGRIVPGPAGELEFSGRKGLIAEEVLPSREIAPPKTAFGAASGRLERAKRSQRLTPVSRPDPEELPPVDDDDDEDRTTAYSKDAMEELQKELRDAAKVSEAPPPMEPLLPEVPEDPSLTFADEVRASEPSPEPVPEEEPRVPSPVPAHPAPETLRPAGAPPALAPSSRPARRRGGVVWFAAGTALALAVGAWSAWQLTIGAPSDPESTNSVDVVDADPVDADPVDADPDEVDADPVDADPVDADPDPVDEVDADPVDPAPQVDGESPPESEPTPEPSEPVVVVDEPEETEPESRPVEVPAPDATVHTLLEQAVEAARARDFPQSEVYARQALMASPHHGAAAYRLAVALFRQQRHDEALVWAERAADWDSRDPLPHALQGDIFMRTGRFHGAASAYREALVLDPQFGPAQRGMDRLRARGVVQD